MQNPKQDTEIIMKWGKLIEVFAFNTINLLLIDRVRGAHILMNCIMAYTKDLEQNNTEGWNKLSKFVEELLF